MYNFGWGIFFLGSVELMWSRGLADQSDDWRLITRQTGSGSVPGNEEAKHWQKGESIKVKLRSSSG